MNIRKLEEKDIPIVAQIEATSFSHPWSETELHQLLQKDLAGYVYEIENTILGYVSVLYTPFDMQILQLAVRKENRQQGIGNQLVQYVLEDAQKKDLEEVSLEVRISNQKAISLYLKNNFKILGERKNFYNNPVENAYVMVCKFQKYNM